MKKYILIMALVPQFLHAETYLVPPSSSGSYAAVISDAAMQQCVILYTKLKRLEDKINSTRVDNYNQASVDNYNSMVSRVSSMSDSFNSSCAGKQSASAYAAAQRLNGRR